MRIKKSIIRKISLFINLVLLITVAVIGVKLYTSTSTVKQLQNDFTWAIGEINARSDELIDLGIAPNGRKMPVESTSTVQMSKVSSPAKSLVEKKIKEYFPKSYVTMTAIAKAESQLNNNAMNWNCYYNKNKTVVYTTRVKGSHSTFCKPEHRKFSWSIDCFVLMKNYPGLKECPKDVTLDEHLAEMAVLSKQRSFQPWSSYNAGAHEKYLTQK